MIIPVVLEKTGSGVTTVTVSPVTGCVTRKTTVWTGVTRLTVKMMCLFWNLRLWLLLVLGLITSKGCVCTSCLYSNPQVWRWSLHSSKLDM